MKEILLVNKPKGITSFDVIREVRRKTGVGKIGHAGTLDPLASGLMILGIGKGTKKLEEYLKLSKTYRATIRLGIATTTGDLEGEVERKRDVSTLSKEEIERATEDLLGTHELSVPLYSAVKIKGKPLYAYARKGKEITPPVKEMTVRGVRDISVFKKEDVWDVKVTLDVLSGVYIRSLAVELGKKLSVPATLASLERTTIGSFELKDAIPLSLVDTHTLDE